MRGRPQAGARSCAEAAWWRLREVRATSWARCAMSPWTWAWGPMRAPGPIRAPAPTRCALRLPRTSSAAAGGSSPGESPRRRRALRPLRGLRSVLLVPPGVPHACVGVVARYPWGLRRAGQRSFQPPVPQRIRSARGFAPRRSQSLAFSVVLTLSVAASWSTEDVFLEFGDPRTRTSSRASRPGSRARKRTTIIWGAWRGVERPGPDGRRGQPGQWRGSKSSRSPVERGRPVLCTHKLPFR